MWGRCVCAGVMFVLPRAESGEAHSGASLTPCIARSGGVPGAAAVLWDAAPGLMGFKFTLGHACLA